MTNIENLQTVNSSISEWMEKYQRLADSVSLIAVSKTRNTEEVLRLHQAGQARFGENYLQEALEKVEMLKAYPIEWHFIGSIQSRKAAQIAENFDWIHSVDRLKVARKLNQHVRPEKSLNVLIQVNLEGETSKGGVAPEQLAELAHTINSLDNLHLRGLMFMPKIHTRFEDQRAVFQHAKTLFDKLRQSIPHLDQLSMGMSGDLEAAIAEGATMVRVGTALFGPRQYNNSDISD